MLRFPHPSALGALAAAITTASLAQTVVDVDKGEFLAETDLLAGFFDNVSFTLGPTTTFNINSGGQIGPVGDLFAAPPRVFDFAGSTVNVNSGGVWDLSVRSAIASNFVLNLFEGGRIDDGFTPFRSLRAQSGSILNLAGGTVDAGISALADSQLNITAGAINRNVFATDADVSISGGNVNNTFFASGGAVSITGGMIGAPGSFATVGSFTGGSVVTMSGGTIGHGLSLDNSQLTLTDGRIGGGFRVVDAGVATISGGAIGADFEITGGSQVTMSGGTVGRGFAVDLGSATTLIGGEFQLDGAPITGLSGGLGTGSVFTGALADGSVFIFSPDVSPFGQGAGDRIAPNTLTLQAAPLAPADTTPMTVSAGAGPKGLRAGQTLTVTGDAALRDNFAAVDATLTINGGSVGEGLEFARSAVTINGGVVGPGVNAFDGSEVVITGGTVGFGFDVFTGSRLTMTGGELGTTSVNSGSEAHISGGMVDALLLGHGSTATITGGDIGTGGAALSSFFARDGSIAEIAGGGFSAGFTASSGSDVTLTGGEFQLGGAPIADLSGGLPDGALFTGTLADGSVLILSTEAGASVAPGAVTLQTAPLSPADPTPMTVSSGSGPNGLRAGQTLTVTGDATLRNNFAAVDATLNIEGGTVGDGLSTARSTVNISGGVIGRDLTAHAGSQVQITGGQVSSAVASGGSDVQIAGGRVDFLLALDGSAVQVSGGSLGALTTRDGSRVTLSGGGADDLFTVFASDGSFIDLVVRDLLLDGAGVTLTQGEWLLINVRGGALLEATLGDGSLIDLTLNDQFQSGADFFAAGATLRARLVPAPGAGLVVALAGLSTLRRRRTPAGA
ncbi:MAG: hypothetical protein D6693_03840 [Planctomycetota bacterium]|nr:MAG: hypothetical protein D6693_03840 [Planctomycetota bacterium]